MTRLLIIDDDTLFDDGIATILRRAGFDVVATERDLAAGVASIVGLRPDVVLCDVMLNGEPTGLDLMHRLETIDVASTPVVLLSSFAPPHLVDVARERGAAGYLTKDANPETLAAAIRIVEAGGQVFPARVAHERAPSPREMEIIRALADGRSSDEAGIDLTISGRTVDTHIARLFERYDVHSRMELVVLAIRSGWITELPTGGSRIAGTGDR